MKIVILGLIAVALVNVAVAAPSDKGEKDDMILEQMKDLRDQLRQQKEQQNLINKLMEEQQEQLKMQQRRDEEQQNKMEEQQNKMEEVTKIQRTRRSENETVEHIKELVLSEIKPMIDVLSECAIGNYTWKDNRDYGEHHKTTTISFGRTFSRKPKVFVSLAGLRMDWANRGQYKLFQATVHSPTTTDFNLHIDTLYDICLDWIEYFWIACA